MFIVGKLAERRAERAAITEWHNSAKVSIHTNYMKDLANLEVETKRRRRALSEQHRASLNKALAIVDAGEV